jgi:hypothetical protein
VVTVVDRMLWLGHEPEHSPNGVPSRGRWMSVAESVLSPVWVNALAPVDTRGCTVADGQPVRFAAAREQGDGGAGHALAEQFVVGARRMRKRPSMMHGPAGDQGPVRGRAR